MLQIHSEMDQGGDADQDINFRAVAVRLMHIGGQIGNGECRSKSAVCHLMAQNSGERDRQSD